MEMAFEQRLGLVTDRIREVDTAETDDFIALLRFAHLDHTRDLRFMDWSEIDFSGLDLRDFDFTGAKLVGCQFDQAKIASARFDAAQVSRRSLRRAEDWNEHVREWSRQQNPPQGRHLHDLAVFSDAPMAPEMVVIPAGEFIMGSPTTEEWRYDSEGPQHLVTIDYRFALGRYAVTYEEWDAYVADGIGNEYRSDDRGWGRGRRPVINVSWNDAQAYISWLSKKTGQRYRLPSEAEWEYACRAGTTTPFSFGNTILTKEANYSESGFGRTAEVGAYPPNAWGLHEMHGNVWEWVEDVWHQNYVGAPIDGSAWIGDVSRTSAIHRVYRGGSWYYFGRFLRSAIRSANRPGDRYNLLGFRVARDLSRDFSASHK